MGDKLSNDVCFGAGVAIVLLIIYVIMNGSKVIPSFLTATTMSLVLVVALIIRMRR